MAKDPAFLFYPNDYLGGTLGLTFEEKGAYIELLMMQFNRGHMTKDMICHMLGQRVDIIWSKIAEKFKIDENGCYYNVRLEEEQLKRAKFTESRRNNVKGTNQHTKKDEIKPKKTPKKESGHMTKHMEDENVNIILSNVNNLFDSKYITDTTKDTLSKLLKNYSKEQIISVIKWAKNDSFWSANFLSINKLNTKNKDGVKFIDVFLAKMSNGKPQPQPTLFVSSIKDPRDYEY